jgi:hypothetical protein
MEYAPVFLHSFVFHPDVPNRANGQHQYQQYSPQWAADVAAQKREMSVQVTNVRRVQRHASLLIDNRSKRDGDPSSPPPMVTVADVSVTCSLSGPKLVTACEIHYLQPDLRSPSTSEPVSILFFLLLLFL